MFDEIQKSIKASLYERIGSPFLGSFLFAFVIYNYKVFVVIFSGLSPTEKFALTDIYLSNQNVGWHKFVPHWLLVPIISAITFSLIYPFIKLLFFSVWEFGRFLSIKVRQKFEGNTILDLPKSMALRKQIYELEQSIKRYFADSIEVETRHAKEIDKLSKSKKELYDENAIAKEQIKELTSNNEAQSRELKANLNEIERLAKTQSNIISEFLGLQSFLEGQWFEIYFSPTGSSGTEYVKIVQMEGQDRYQYFRNGTFAFILTDVKFNAEQKSISWNKMTNSSPSLSHSIENLRITNANTIDGNDNLNNRVIYTRQQKE